MKLFWLNSQIRGWQATFPTERKKRKKESIVPVRFPDIHFLSQLAGRLELEVKGERLFINVENIQAEQEFRNQIQEEYEKIESFASKQINILLNQFQAFIISMVRQGLMTEYTPGKVAKDWHFVSEKTRGINVKRKRSTKTLKDFKIVKAYPPRRSMSDSKLGLNIPFPTHISKDEANDIHTENSTSSPIARRKDHVPPLRAEESEIEITNDDGHPVIYVRVEPEEDLYKDTIKEALEQYYYGLMLFEGYCQINAKAFRYFLLPYVLNDSEKSSKSMKNILE
jgi:hypothetical protein